MSARAVLAHADPVQRQGDGVATVERPAVFGKAGRGMRVMMQYGIDRQRLLLCPVPGAIARMGIAHQILQRMDDSVLDQDGAMLRRARGFVPDAITLPAGFSSVPSILATGADMKNTFCLVRTRQKVFFMSAPVARIEGTELKPAGNVMASGTNPRARRSMAPS